MQRVHHTVLKTSDWTMGGNCRRTEKARDGGNEEAKKKDGWSGQGWRGIRCYKPMSMQSCRVDRVMGKSRHKPVSPNIKQSSGRGRGGGGGDNELLEREGEGEHSASPLTSIPGVTGSLHRT